jgi:hypothetical protein
VIHGGFNCICNLHMLVTIAAAICINIARLSYLKWHIEMVKDHKYLNLVFSIQATLIGQLKCMQLASLKVFTSIDYAAKEPDESP